jgi:hypothetical protein
MITTDIGYYSVNGVSYGTNKVSAILDAQKSNSELQWNFFDEVLNKVNWTEEPVLSLDTLYKMRAQQIRDKYDYLVVFLSGGADSNNVIRTFMNNNIHVDEVVAIIPEEGLKNFDSNDTDVSACNVMSEVKYAQYPILQEVYTKSPLTKITVVDFFNDIVNAKSDAWIYQGEGDLVGMTSHRYGKLESVPHIKQLAEQGKRIASIWGTDKPILALRPDGNIYMVIADTPVYLAKYPFDKHYNNVDRVLFYYSYELPEIMVKQAHVVAKEIYKPENQHIYKSIGDQQRRYYSNSEKTTDQLINEIMQVSEDAMMYSPKTVYQRSIVPFIYPSTHDPKLFQTRKFDANRTFLTAYSDWITKLHGGSRLCQMITSDFTLFYKNISPKYLNPNRTGFHMCIKTFAIGTQEHFNSLTKGKK